MSKKEKDRKKKDGSDWAWPDTPPPSTKRAATDAHEPSSGPARSGIVAPAPSVPPPPISSPALSDEAREITRLAGVPSTRLGAGYDLDSDTVSDVAPIGPTERAEAVDSVRPPPLSRPPPSRPSVPERTPAQIEQQIRELEARLDQLIGESPPRERPKAEPAAERPADPRPEPEAHVTARELLASDFYRRQWGKLGMRQRAEEVDELGLDPAYEARFIAFLDFLYRVYFRVEARGVENVPREGRCLVVANHSGGPLPYDGLMLRTLVRREISDKRDLRWLAEDFIYYLPFVGTAMNRLGAVRACQENAERLLAGERLVAVFPEGAKGIGKLYKQRYKLQRFGRGGFIRLALRTGTPIVPCAIVGAEEANPMLARIEYMTKALGIPYLPVTPTFPALGPIGLLPAPTKWKVELGEPIDLGDLGPDAADDDILVGRLSERVRGTIQGMLDRTVERRRSIWFG